MKNGNVYHFYVRESTDVSHRERVDLFERWVRLSSERMKSACLVSVQQITEVAHAVAYMHEQRIVHADLRAVRPLLYKLTLAPDVRSSREM